MTCRPPPRAFNNSARRWAGWSSPSWCCRAARRLGPWTASTYLVQRWRKASKRCQFDKIASTATKQQAATNSFTLRGLSLQLRTERRCGSVSAICEGKPAAPSVTRCSRRSGQPAKPTRSWSTSASLSPPLPSPMSSIVSTKTLHELARLPPSLGAARQARDCGISGEGNRQWPQRFRLRGFPARNGRCRRNAPLRQGCRA